MAQAHRHKFGDIEAAIIPGKEKGPAVILLHGYGADMTDLMPLADYMNVSRDVTWIFPNGPMNVVIGPGFSGRSWYEIDMSRIEKAMISGEHVDLSDKRPPGLDRARDQVSSLYEEVRKNHSKVILGGFSQGAMLSVELTLTQKVKPEGLIIFSGVLMDQENWKRNAQTAASVPFIQSHGRNDAILGFSGAEKLYCVLTDAGLYGEFIEFSGGHEIPPKVLEKTSDFLKAQLR